MTGGFFFTMDNRRVAAVPDAATDDVREQVSLGGRVLHAAGMSDLIWGHVSVRDPARRGAWMKRSGLGFEEVDPDDVLLVGRSGEVLDGNGERHIEYPIHTEILAARPDVASVVHAHPTHSIAFAATGAPLRPLSHGGALFAPPDVARFSGTGDLIRTRELGEAVAEELADRNAIVLPSHGIVAVGSDLPEAVMTAILLERACQLQLLTMAAGGPAVWSSDEEAAAKRARCWPPSQFRAGWDYLVRRVH